MDNLLKIEKILNDEYIVSIQTINWSTSSENILKDLGEKAYCYSWLHDEMYIYYKYISNILNILLLLSSFSSFLIFFLEYGNTLAFKIIPGIQLSFSLFVVISPYNKMHIIHGKLSKDMLSFYKKTSYELVKSPQSREEVQGCIKSSKYIYEMLKQQSIELGVKRSIKNKFKNKFNNNTFSKPNLDDIYELQIISNSNSTTSDLSVHSDNNDSNKSINLKTIKNKIVNV
jgi:hypothetical protein